MSAADGRRGRRIVVDLTAAEPSATATVVAPPAVAPEHAPPPPPRVAPEAPTVTARVDLPPPTSARPQTPPPQTPRPQAPTTAARVELPPPPPTSRPETPRPQAPTVAARVDLPPPPPAALRRPPATAARVQLPPPSGAPLGSLPAAVPGRLLDDGRLLAPFGRRFVASLIDAAVQTVLVLLIGIPVMSALASEASSSNDAGLAVLVLLGAPIVAVGVLVDLFYAAPLMARGGKANGQTLGKQAMGLRVVCVDGGEVSFGRAFLRQGVWRYLVLTIGGLLLFAVPTLLDALWPLWDPRRQALHDKGARTLVVEA